MDMTGLDCNRRNLMCGYWSSNVTMHFLFAHMFINACMQTHANYKVLLLIWNDGLAYDAGYHLMEVFSGEGRVSQKWYHGEHPQAHTSV